MVATIEVFISTGGTNGSPGAEVTTEGLGPPNVRFKRADDSTIDSVNVMTIPAAGTNYSRWKTLFGKCTVAPNTQVDNFRFHTDGTSFGTGIACRIGLQFPNKNSGSTSGYEVADVVDEELVVGHGGITSDNDAFTYTSGAPLTGPTISEAGSIINATNETTNYILLQLNTINTAAPGNLADETFTLLYDEI